MRATSRSRHACALRGISVLQHCEMNPGKFGASSRERLLQVQAAKLGRVLMKKIGDGVRSPIEVPFSALADLPPMDAFSQSPCANEPCLVVQMVHEKRITHMLHACRAHFTQVSLPLATMAASSSSVRSPIGVPFSALADLPPVVAMPQFPAQNEPCLRLFETAIRRRGLRRKNACLRA